MARRLLIALAALVAVGLPNVAAHGFMSQPAARNYLTRWPPVAGLQPLQWTPNGFSGGGAMAGCSCTMCCVAYICCEPRRSLLTQIGLLLAAHAAAVPPSRCRWRPASPPPSLPGVKRLSGSGTVPWPQRAAPPGVCGDPSTVHPDNVDASAPANAHMLGVEPAYTSYITAVPPPSYAPGSALPATFAIQAYHKGRIGFQLCRHTGAGEGSRPAGRVHASVGAALQAGAAGPPSASCCAPCRGRAPQLHATNSTPPCLCAMQTRPRRASRRGSWPPWRGRPTSRAPSSTLPASAHTPSTCSCRR